MKQQYEIGMVGLGVMGRNLLLNMADQGVAVVGYDNNSNQLTHLYAEAEAREVHGTTDLQKFMGLLRRPRVVILLVPAGAPVDSVITALVPYLQPGDTIIDAGNSHFKDTDLRIATLAAKGIHFMGIGISGGEVGARQGPSIMPGGTKEAYERVRPVLEAIAAKVNNDPCVTYLGSGSVGHFVKMVHNGIEYGIMQLIAETYSVMKHGLQLNEKQLHAVYAQWNEGELNSYLIEITSTIFAKIDEQTDEYLINKILAIAKQNGTGMWTSQSAMELQVPTPTIDVAVTMRDLSVVTAERAAAQVLYQRPTSFCRVDRDLALTQLHDALLAAMLITYAQGMALLAVASNHYHYQVDLAAVARIWRGGCIIRTALLEPIYAAFQANGKLANLLLDPNLSQLLLAHQEALRQIGSQALLAGIPIPGLMSALSYFDAYRRVEGSANLIQAQRDYFGAHTYERIDQQGKFHTQW